MASGKTAHALMMKYNFEERGLKVLLVKPRLDTRDGVDVIRSRCGIESHCEHFEKLRSRALENYDVIIIDEVQFLTKEEVNFLTYIVDDYGIKVFAYGLKTDFQGKLFEGSYWLLACADKIEELKTTCWCGHKAIYNARLDRKGNLIKDGEQIELGGNDKYLPLCRKHFNKEYF
jgi:thymidine kinase